MTMSQRSDRSLVCLFAEDLRVAEMRAESGAWPSWDLSYAQLADLELLANGAFSPLTGFMTRPEHEAVCRNMRLPSGHLWAVPVVLDVTSHCASLLSCGSTLALRDPEGVMVAALHVEDVWVNDQDSEIHAIYGKVEGRHAGAAAIRERNSHCVGGRVEAIEPAMWRDLRAFRHSPAESRARFDSRGWQSIVAYRPGEVLSRGEQASLLKVAEEPGVGILFQAIIAPAPADAQTHDRIRALAAGIADYPHGSAMLSVLPLPSRGTRLRQELWHAAIMRNFGCAHIVDSAAGDHEVEPPWNPESLRPYEGELDIALVQRQPFDYVPELATYMARDAVPIGYTSLHMSDTDARERLERTGDIPAWFAPQAVVQELARRYPPRRQQGLTIFFTGLSGSGKSTIASLLHAWLMEHSERRVTSLDGDLVRKHLSSELGYSKAARDINVRRIGFVAAEVTKHGGVAICAPIAPYDVVRREVRRMVNRSGGFVLVHVATPLNVCEQRDRKGLYAKARAGLLPAFTGVSDDYEVPTDADIVIDTEHIDRDAAVALVVRYLEQQGYLEPRVEL